MILQEAPGENPIPWSFQPPVAAYILWHMVPFFHIKASNIASIFSSDLPLCFLSLSPFFFFLPHCAAYSVLVPQLGIEPMSPAVEAQNPNLWTTRDVSLLLLCYKEPLS